MATDEHILASLEKYHEPYAIFDDYYCGAIWSATVLQEQGVAALPRFAPYAASDYCADVLRHINHPFALTLLIRVAGHTKRCHDRMTKAIAAFPHAAMAALTELLAQKEENSWRIMLMTMLISQPALAEQVIPWLSTPAVAVLKSCQQQLTQPSNHASADLLPAIVVSPPWLSKKKKSPIPVLDLAPLGIEPICYLTEEISNQLLAKYIWYSKHITVSHEESTTNLLARMGFQRRIAGTYIKAPEAVVEAWLNEDYSTLLSEFKVFHSPTGHYWQLGILTTLPLEKAVKAWNALTLSPHTDTEYAMLHFGLKGLPGLVNSLARYPQEALPITNYFAASELAPAVARAFNKLKTLRENARSWLLKYPEHALAALNSRLNCAQEMARRDSVGEVPPVPWRTVVGSGIAGEAKLDHLRLVSLGMRCWQDIEHYGLRIWFTDPDTGSILHLSRSWPRSEQENSPAATRRLFSFQAGALAGGQIVSQAAKRSADGELLLATRNRLSSVVPLSPDAWQMLSAPLRQPGIVALREYLRQRPPACIRPLNQVDNLFILPVAECISLGWDSSRQTLDAQVISGEGEDNLLTLSLPASACSPFAVERMAALLQQTDDPVSLVSGFVSFVEGQLTLEPRVMMTKTRAWALDAETAPVAPLPSASVLPVPSTAHQLLMRCQALLIQLLHNGWRYQEQSAISQAELLANDLTAVGFYRLAHVLAQFRNTESEARVEAMNNGVLLCEQLFPMLQQQG